MIDALATTTPPPASAGTPEHRPGQLRVLMVTPRYPPFVGGTETHTAEVARRLSAAGEPLGATVTVLTTDPDAALPPLERDGEHGPWVRRFRAWPSTSRWAGGPASDLHYAPGLGRAIVEGRAGWDLLHLQGYHTLVAPIALMAARRAGLPYIVSFHSGGHSSRGRTLLRGGQRELLRPLIAGARRLVAVSTFEAAYFRRRLRLPPERFVVIPNGVELGHGASDDLAPRGGDDGDGPLLVSVGRLERYKGHQRVIAALPAVQRARPDARLRIVGAGPYEDELRRLAARLGVAGRVEIAGLPGADRAGMARLLARAALVLQLSEWESQGIAIGEAVALGRPALVAATTALSELAERGLAHAIPLNSTPAQTAAAILAAIDAPPPPAASLPTWDGCAAALAALYRAEVAAAPGTVRCAS